MSSDRGQNVVPEKRRKITKTPVERPDAPNGNGGKFRWPPTRQFSRKIKSRTKGAAIVNHFL
jgi:hypothetical protein